MSARGSCICGAVRFRAEGPLRPPVACHCVQCRKGSGHFAAATAAPRERVAIEGRPTWYAYRPGIRRGFCATCGAQLFWEREGSPLMSIWMGAFDKPVGLTLSGHIWVAEKGDYYPLADGLPCADGDRPGSTEWRP